MEPLSSNELARREGGGWVLRPMPLRVRVELGEMVAQDGHRLRGSFVCGMRAIDDPTERKMLAEAFEGPVIDDQQLARHFAEPLRAAARQAAGARPGAAWLEAEGRGRLCDALLAAGKAVAFAAGIEIVPPCEVRLDSPTLERERLDELERSIHQKRATTHAEQLQRAADLLQQFRALRESAPELKAGRILEQINPSDRGSLLQTLLLAAAEEQGARRFLVVAGSSLVSIRLDDGKPRTDVHVLPGDLGPLRSIQRATLADGDVLLVGARSGVLVLDAETFEVRHLLRDDSITSQRGISRALAWHGRIWACHGEAGIVAWDVDATDSPAFALRTGGTMVDPKHLSVLDERRLLFAADAGLMTLDDAGGVSILAPGGEIVAILPAEGRQIVVYDDGSVCEVTPEGAGERSVRGPRVSAAGLLPWLGDVRLLLAESEGSVRCVGLDDTLVSDYAGPHRGLRMLAGSPACVAGATGDRQRVVLWHAWDGRRPAHEINIASLVRHRVADLEVG